MTKHLCPTLTVRHRRWAWAGRFRTHTHAGFLAALSCIVPLMLILLSSIAVATDPIASEPSVASGQSLTRLPDAQWLLSGGSPDPGQIQLVDHTSAARIVEARLVQPRRHHSATLLPDGRVLIYGGVGRDGAVLGTAERFDPSNGRVTSLGSIGLVPRSEHTANVLSDGRLLFAGGTDSEHQILRDAELYDPDTGQIERLDGSIDAGRRQQLSALLPDRSVLLWAGLGEDGLQRDDGDLLDAQSKSFVTIPGAAADRALSTLDGGSGPTVLDSDPAPRRADVALSKRLAVRFNERMAVESLNQDSVTLIGPSGSTPVKVVAVEQGLLLFVTPVQPLLPGANYTLFISGAQDRQGRDLPFVAIDFATASLNAPTSGRTDTPSGSEAVDHSKPIASGPLAEPKGPSLGSASANGILEMPSTFFPWLVASETVRAPVIPYDDSELWTPGEAQRDGRWTSGRRQLAEQTLPRNTAVRRALYGDAELVAAVAGLTPAAVAAGALDRFRPNYDNTAADGVTSVAGQVLKLNGRPLDNVSLAIAGVVTRTDANGEFELHGVPAGRQVLIIDGATAGNDQIKYGRHEYGFDVQAGQVNPLPFVIWMTRLDTRHATTIPSPTITETVVTSPKIPGLELRLPAGTVIRDAKGQIVTELTITAIPTDQPPFPLPAEAPVPVYFTIQPGGASLEDVRGLTSAGARLIYPNFTKSSPGSRISFWNYDSASKGWYVYGEGTVSTDGQQVIPDPGVAIHEFSGAMVSLPSNAPAIGPVAGDGAMRCGDPVDCATGLFINEEIDLVVPDVIPLELVRSYRPLDSISRAFGIGTGLSFELYMVGDTSPWTYQDLILPDGAHVHFERISAGTSYNDAIYHNVSTPGIYFGAILTYRGGESSEYWNLTLRNGTTYFFPEATAASDYRDGTVTSIVDGRGNKLTLTRSGDVLTRVASPNGRHMDFTYDSDDRVTEASDDLGRTVKYSYDSAGYLSQVTDPAGNITRYSYDGNGRMTSVTDKRGNAKVTNTYDSNSRVTKQVYADGKSMSFTYTLEENGTGVTQTDITDRRGMQQQTAYNTDGYPVSITRGVGLSIEQATTLTRDEGNLVTATTDTLGRTTAYQYDDVGNMTQIEQADGSQVSIAYDQKYSQPIAVTDANGHVTNFAYDDSSGALIAVADPLGHTVEFDLDSQGRPTQVTDALGHTLSVGYFGADAANWTDSMGRATVQISDAVGRATSLIDGANNTATFTYDQLDRVLTQTDPNGATLTFEYDPNGNLTARTDANQHRETFTYDAMNRVKKATNALGQMESYTYEAGGAVSRITERSGQVTGFTYDKLGRVTKVGYGGTAEAPTAYTRTVQLSWDKGNRVTQITDSQAGVISRSYDSLDRLTKETTPQGAVSYSYDLEGRRTSMTVQGQPKLSYTWDAADRLTKIKQAAGAVNGNVAQTISFGYDAANRRTKLTLPNGIQTLYSYNAADDLTGISYKKADGTVLGDLTYGYDQAGRRISVGGSLAAVKLPKATSSDATYDAANQLTQWNGVARSYDLNGNLTNDGSRSYSWDATGRLTGITGSATASFAYDGLSRRMGKTVNGKTTGYLYDGDTFVQEKGGTGSADAVTANLLTGGIDEWFVRYGSQAATYPLMDALGSTVAEADATQAVVASYQYQAYGTTTRTGTVTGTTQQYTGRENDGTGLYYYRARYYDPSVGRFISQDPIGWGDGSNVYSYTSGDPVNYTDPTGEFGVPGAFIGAGLDLGFQMLVQGRSLKCVNWMQVGVSGALGAVGGAGLGGSFSLTKGSMKAANAIRRYRRLHNVPRTHDVHHWAIEKSSWIGKKLPGSIVNHPANFYSIERSVHQNIHHGYGPLGRWWYGTPDWAKAAEISLGSGAVAEAVDPKCDC